MKNAVSIFCLLVLVSCGKAGKNGSDGISPIAPQSIAAVSYGVDFEDIEPGLACAAGGISLFTFEDENTDGIFQNGEAIIKVKALCNGSNGSSAAITLDSIASSSACPAGGVKITSGASSIEVCNGEAGLNGEQGLAGIQGVPGIAGSAGAAGTVVTPVKFCASDNSTYPEYGLMVGEELFAVYWGPTPASPNASQAFLTKLIAGNYMSTGGNNCLFSVP